MGDVPPRERVGLTPEDVLRALLDDRSVADVLMAAGSSAAELRVAVERRWLQRLRIVDEETLRGRRADVGALLHALNSASSELDGVSTAAKVVLGRALRESAGMHARRITADHLLVALIAGRDPVVAPAAAEIGLRAGEVRRIVSRRSRRAG